MKITTQPQNAGYSVTYNQIKQARKEYLKKNYKNYKKPWYMLVSGKQYNYEARHESWGDYTKWYRKPSETKILHGKNTNKPMNRVKYLESLVQHKLNKWIGNNPKPNDKQNLFYEEFTKEWEAKKEKMLQHYRDVVIAIYYKLKVYGRFNINKQGYPKLIALIPNKTNELFSNKTVNDLNKDSVLLKRAKIISIKERAKNPKLIACLLEDIRGKCGRIIVA